MLPSKAPTVAATVAETATRSAWTRIARAELLDELFAVATDEVAAFEARLAQGTPTTLAHRLKRDVSLVWDDLKPGIAWPMTSPPVCHP